MSGIASADRSIDEAYFEWLTTHVHIQHGAQTYRELCWVLYQKEFIGFVPYDDNRVQDGLDLLAEFFTEHGLVAEAERNGTGCSFLELVISLSRRLAYITGHDPVDHAWTLLGNLGLHPMSDPLRSIDHETIDDILNRVIYRHYEPNGSGGLFPLSFYDKHTPDQRRVELWDQMNDYAEENMDPHDL